MLLSQQAQLVRLDEQRAVVRVAGNWMAMVQSRLPLLQNAMARALGGQRQLVLEGGEGLASHRSPPAAPPSHSHAGPSSSAGSSSNAGLSSSSGLSSNAGLPGNAPVNSHAVALANSVAPANAGAPAISVALGHAGQPGPAAADFAPGVRASAHRASPALVPLQSPPLPSSATALHPMAAAAPVPAPVASVSSELALAALVPMPGAAGAQMPVPAAVGRPEAIQEKAQRLAEFFSGEVISLDDPMEVGLETPLATAAADFDDGNIAELEDDG
jgi:DNA polymerase-3 subunit gamma/tau